MAFIAGSSTSELRLMGCSENFYWASLLSDALNLSCSVYKSGLDNRSYVRIVIDGAKSEIYSGHNLLAFSFLYEDVKNISVKLQSESIESSTSVSSTKSSPKHIVTSAEEQIHGMIQQQRPIADLFHRASETLTESQDLSISFLAEEYRGSSFLGCQSVFSFLAEENSGSIKEMKEFFMSWLIYTATTLATRRQSQING